MTELERRPPGEIQPTTWGAVVTGNMVRDKNDRFHIVLSLERGMVSLEAVSSGARATFATPPADREVDIYVPSEAECLLLLDKELGARQFRLIEEREHSIARALNWRVEPVKANARVMRDHLDMLHGIYVDDVLRKHTGTAVNPAPRGQKAKAIQELRDLHDEAHADPDLWPMAFPHVHTLDSTKEN